MLTCLLRRTGAGLAALFLSIGALHAEVLIDPATKKPVRYAGKFSNRPINLPGYRIKPGEMRGVWVATVENLDFDRHDSISSFKTEFTAIVRNLKRGGFNAIFFQVRPHCDAFYASAINPWSARLTGVEGRGIAGFDPLAWMVAESHRNGLQIHAWLNPYRVIGNTPMDKKRYLASLSLKNFARRNPRLVLAARIEKGWSLFLNPGEPAVRRHIADTVAEIVRKYPVDGIHFDDYFYLYQDIGNIDGTTYAAQNPRRLTLADWRRENVNATIREVSQAVRREAAAKKRRVSFGVSPFGIWANRKHNPAGSLTGGKESYYAQFADTRMWVKSGLIDYIAPQLYWPFTHEVAAYAALADWWADTVKGTRVKLYTGNAFYRVGRPGWNSTEIANQLRYNQNRPEISGEIFFSYRHMFGERDKTRQKAFQLLMKMWGIRI